MNRNSHFQKSHSHPVPSLPRLTRQQQVVLSALEQQPDPISAQALYRLLLLQQTIGLATVYRALETLKLHGLILSRAYPLVTSFLTNRRKAKSPIVSDFEGKG